ncbi:MAG: LPXTG cell wall anchor domain-containing protein, partial [Streptococcus sp.]|nr:LPXTG cell wall anchor domain-containing protein [Streptococcus sp.]
IQRKVKDASGQTSATREFLTNQPHFLDRSLNPQLAYTYTVKAMLGEVSTQVSEQATVETYSELMDDRDSRIQYGAAFGNWADSELFGGTEKFADLSKGDYTDKDLTATIPFTGVGIEIYGLKSSELGLATAKIDGKEVGELDFHTAGATEKGSLIGRFAGLSDGPHTLTLRVKREHKGRGSERSKISLDYFKILAGTGNTIEKMDDRDPRIQYGAQFKDWSDPELYGGTEKYADINNSDSSAASEAQATISFTGTGIRIFGLKSLALGRARVTLDGKEMPSLDFYTSGATEKRAFIGEFTNLTDGPHTLTLRVDPDSPEGRKKISLDSFDIIKAPAVGLDSPSIAPLKENDKTISLSLPAGDWEAIAVTFPGVKDPLVLRKVDETHLVTSGDQTILSIQDNQVQIPIPDETNRKAGNAIEAYAIQGTTTSSPVVAVFTKKDEKKVDEKQPTTSKGDEPAPTVDIPEYTDPIGTAGQEEPPTVTIPEYTKPIGTAGQEVPPTVEMPEYTEPIGTAGQEEAPTVEKPEYTKPIGTSGDQAAPSLSLPDYPVQVLKDKETGVEIIGGASDLEGISHVSIRRVLAQELFGKTYDAYDLQLKNPTDHSVQPKGAVLVRLPVSASVENVYYLTPNKELQALDFTVRDGKVEFITNHFSTYAVVYQATGTSSNTEEKPSASDTETLAHEAEQLSASSNLAKAGNHSPKEELPATGEASNPLLFLAGLSLALTATFMLKGRKDDSN